MATNTLQTINSYKPPLTGAASSLIGGRSENQDNMAWTSTEMGFIVVVCDGMGGGPGGRTASAVAVQTVIQTVVSYSSAAAIEPEKCLRIAINNAEAALEAHMTADPSLQGMGTTLLALLINEHSAVAAHLGDSRIYRLHGNSILMRTRDHSLVAELVANKVLTEEQARCSPQSNVITRGLGSVNNHVPDVEETPYCAGDRFILCTDGVWGIMPHEELLTHLCSKNNPINVVNTLQAEVDRRGASTGGHHDNHTLVIIETSTNSTLKDKMSTRLKVFIATLAGLLLFSAVLNGILYTSINKTSSLSAQQLAQAEDERIQAQQKAIANGRVLDNTTVNYETRIFALENQVATLQGEKEVLENEYQALSDRNDSLKAELQAANNPSYNNTGNVKNGRINDINSMEMTPSQLAESIMSELKAMKNCRAKGDYRNASKKQGVSRQRLQDWLNKLKKSTTPRYDSKIDELRSHLKNSQTFMLIDNTTDSQGYYHPTKPAKDDIANMIKSFKVIQDDINK